MPNIKHEILVSGLVIGMRKSGTTWLYENFKKIPLVSVSNKIKESGFFTNNSNLTINSYHELFSKNKNSIRLEVDTSIIYDRKAASRIYRYNPDMKIIAIKRKPKEYVISRFIHAKRKGLLSENNIFDALSKQKWFREELKFNKNINRFYSKFPYDNICILDFEDLKSSPQTFFMKSVKHLTSLEPDFSPDSKIINPAKISSFPILTRSFSITARFFRKLGMYKFVNFFKKLGFHKTFESSATPIVLTKREIDLIHNIVCQDEKEYKK